MAVANGTPTTVPLANGSNTTTTSFTSTNQPLYVLIGWWTTAVSAITFGAQSLSPVAQSGSSSGGDRAEIWELASPTAGTATITITHTGGQAAGTAIIFNTTGQDTTTPHGSFGSAISAANGTSTGSQSVSGAATGDLTIAVVANGGGVAATPTATGAGTTTEIFDAASNAEGTEAFTGTNVVTAVSAAFGTAQSWAIAWAVLKASSGPLPPVGIPVGTPTWGFPHPPMSVA
jgi:hypothetical protein